MKYCTGSSTQLVAINSRIFRNSARNGGSVYVENLAHATFTGSEIFANVAPRYGGASGLYLNFATAALTNCNVFDNEGGAAAGVKLHYGSARLSGCRVYRNRAPVGAGAFAMTGYFEITNSHFYDNHIVDNNPPRGLPCAHTSKKHSATLQITCRTLARGGG
jgi:hypothetical protein